ncbi:MAG: succinylglutamate desuccinylase/aspartoacylase family protein [Chloroflexi bacterium]|nr:succinylglutamate desuccinylase/aspartoacylase family protein [Chloroflexota bacterium]
MTSARPPQTISVEDFHHSQLAAGSKRCWRMTVADSLLGAISVPLLTCKGGDGRVVLAMAGIHGDEFEGMAAIRQLFHSLDPEDMRGTFLGVPISNPFAYEAQTRESPATVDGKNLARVFPGKDDGTPTEVLASRLFHFVLRNLTGADLFVDLHSAGTRYVYLPMVGYRDVETQALTSSIEAARCFGIDNVWIIPDAPGPLNAETARRGIPTIGTEVRGQGGCAPEDVDLYARGLRNCLRYRGILPGGPPPTVTSKAMMTRWVHVCRSGFFVPAVRLGSRVERDQLLATVIDAYGEPLEEVRAEREGQIWAVRTFATVHRDDIAFILAHRPQEG